MASKEKVSEKVQAAIFAQLLSNPSNEECADCDTKAPNWVSLDFGVFICMRCSGVHRQIGPHITRVRSVKLDGWTKENIEIMATVGNRVANDYYEHRMPTGYRRLRTNASTEECRRYVDEKYIKKAFVPSGFKEPVKDFVACRANGTKPDFSYSTQNQNKQQEQQQQQQQAPPKPVFQQKQQQTQPQSQPQAQTQPQTQHQSAFKFLTKKSTSLDKKPVTQQHPDLLSPAEVDLLGNYSDPTENQETHSASPPPKKINFANFKKAQSQPPVPHHQNQAQADHMNSNQGWNQEGSHGINNSANNQGQPQGTQVQENKVDLMKLYSQPQGHQNHFMQGMPQGWQQQYNNGWNNGTNHGYNAGYNNMGHPGGYPQNYGGQMNANMGYNPYMNYGGGHMGTGQGPVQNQYGGNGFVQAQGPNKFF